MTAKRTRPGADKSIVGRTKDMTGWRHPDGGATVLGPAGLRTSDHGSRQGMYWRLRCDCGAVYEARGCRLRLGDSVRCYDCSMARVRAARKASGRYACPYKGQPKPPRKPDVACERCGTVCRTRHAGRRYCSHRCFCDARAGRPLPAKKAAGK